MPQCSGVFQSKSLSSLMLAFVVNASVNRLIPVRQAISTSLNQPIPGVKIGKTKWPVKF